jgi:hypothetical protein
MPVTGKSEVHALQYAACMFMNILDQVLWCRLDGWEPNEKGLNIEVSPGKTKNDFKVLIHPVGWPQESNIHSRFSGNDKIGWHFWEATIDALHLMQDGKQFNVFFQMNTAACWKRPTFHCFTNGGAAFFKQAAFEAGFTVED